jgi:hypothetical protein
MTLRYHFLYLGGTGASGDDKRLSGVALGKARCVGARVCVHSDAKVGAGGGWAAGDSLRATVPVLCHCDPKILHKTSQLKQGAMELSI